MRSPGCIRAVARPFGAALMAVALTGRMALAFIPPSFPATEDQNPASFFPVPAGVRHDPPPPYTNPPQAEPDPPRVHTTPEPGTLVLGLIGGGIAAAAARRKSRMATGRREKQAG